MKLKFKQHQYQADATNAVVNIFSGQTKGQRKDIVGRNTIDDNLFGKRIEIEEIFSNKKLEITENDILNFVFSSQMFEKLLSDTQIESRLKNILFSLKKKNIIESKGKGSEWLWFKK